MLLRVNGIESIIVKLIAVIEQNKKLPAELFQVLFPVYLL